MVAAALVRPDDEVMLISTGGVLIRTAVKSIREMSRSTQGVTLINLDDGEKLAGLERVLEADDEPEGEADGPSRDAARLIGARHCDADWLPRCASTCCEAHHDRAMPNDNHDRTSSVFARRSTRSTARCSRCSTSARRTRRRSASSRAGPPRIGPSARRRCCAASAARTAARCPNAAVTGVFRQVMSACLALEQQTARRVSRSGRHVQSRRASASISATFVERRAVCDDRRRLPRGRGGQCDYAVVPVENSTEGAVGRTLDLMCQTPLTIVRRDHSCASSRTCCPRPRRSTAIAKVYSHAQSLAQCVHWLAQHLPRASARRGGEQRRSGAARRGGTRLRGDRRRERRADLRARRARRRTSRTSPTTRRASGCSARTTWARPGSDGRRS